jgi:uncharacterized membrane protein YbhN (UPF0104 family)
MGAALVAYGGTAAGLAAVLLYRLITYWAVLPVGGVCYLSLCRRRTPGRGARRPAAYG